MKALKLAATAIATVFALGTTAAFAASDAAATPATPAAKSSTHKSSAKKHVAPKKGTKSAHPAAAPAQ